MTRPAPIQRKGYMSKEAELDNFRVESIFNSVAIIWIMTIEEFLEMSIRKSCILTIVLCLVFLGVALDAHSDQNIPTTADTGKSMDNQAEATPDESAAPSDKSEATAKIVVAEPLFLRLHGGFVFEANPRRRRGNPHG